MKRHQQSGNDRNVKAWREGFADGSAIVTYPDGGMAIFESKLAQASALCERKAKNGQEPLAPVAMQENKPIVNQAAGRRKIGHAAGRA